MVNEVTHIVWQNDSMLAHVTVVAQHAHRHMGWHFGKLPENIIEGPSKREGVFCLSYVTLRMLCVLSSWSNSPEHLKHQEGFRDEQYYNLSMHPWPLTPPTPQFPCIQIKVLHSPTFNSHLSMSP